MKTERNQLMNGMDLCEYTTRKASKKQYPAFHTAQELVEESN